jgi:hypothetical protein
MGDLIPGRWGGVKSTILALMCAKRHMYVKTADRFLQKGWHNLLALKLPGGGPTTGHNVRLLLGVDK